MNEERPGPLQGAPSGPKASIRDKFEWLLNETFDAMTGNTSEAGLDNIRLAAEVEELKGLLETEKMAVQRLEADLAAAQEQNRILARSPVLVSTWTAGAEQFREGFEAALNGEQRWTNYSKAWYLGYDFQKGLPTHDASTNHWMKKFAGHVQYAEGLLEKIAALEKQNANALLPPSRMGWIAGEWAGLNGQACNEFEPGVANEDFIAAYRNGYQNGAARQKIRCDAIAEREAKIAALETDNAKLEKERDEARAYRDTLLANRASHKFAEEIGFSHGYREGVESAWGPGTPEEFIGDYRQGFRRGRIMRHRLHEETKAKEASQKLYEDLAAAIKQTASTIPPF